MADLRRLGPDDLETVLRFREASFGPLRETARPGILAFLEAGAIWGIEEGGQLLGTARLSLLDHWFGGRRVPCQHVSSVAVPPEHRGRGVASALMTGVVERGIADGAALSLLYPATTALYRKLGWEQAGSFARYRLDARLAPARGTAMRPVRDERDWKAVRACHEAMSSTLSGPTVHDEHDWNWLREARFAYVLDAEDGDGVESFVCFGQEQEPGDWQYSLEIGAWAATTRRGLEALLALVGHHGSIGKDARFTGPVPHPLAFLTPEQDVRPDGGMYWMARGLDLPVAVAARGFAPGISLEVAFAVEDPLVPAARGPWRLEVAGGAGKLVPAASADIVLDARAVGPTYTGFTTPAQLAVAGLASGPPEALALLGTAFAGPHPVFFEFF